MIEGVSALGMLSSGSSVGAPTAPAAPAVGASFEQALGQAIGSAVDTLKAGEAFAIQGVQGAATPMKVVEVCNGCAALTAVRFWRSGTKLSPPIRRSPGWRSERRVKMAEKRMT